MLEGAGGSRRREGDFSARARSLFLVLCVSPRALFIARAEEVLGNMAYAARGREFFPCSALGGRGGQGGRQTQRARSRKGRNRGRCGYSYFLRRVVVAWLGGRPRPVFGGLTPQKGERAGGWGWELWGTGGSCFFFPEQGKGPGQYIDGGRPARERART